MQDTGRRRRLRWVVPLGLSVCLLAPPSASGDDAPRNTKPYTRFKILLGQIVNGTLPFDVPFIIWGEVDQEMTEDIERSEVTLLSAEFESEASCKDIGENEKKYRLLRTAKVSKWTDEDFTDRGLTPPTDPVVRARHQFEMLIPPLEPRRVYCFLFQVAPGKQLEKSQQALLIAEIKPAYRRFLRELGFQKEFGDNEAEQLRKDLSRAMMAAVPLSGASPRKGSVFDPDAKKEDVDVEFRGPMGVVLTQRLAVKNGLAKLQSFDAGSRSLTDLQQWQKWSRSPALRNLLQAASGSQLADLSALAAMTDEEVRRALVGLLPADQDAVISDLWQVDPSVGVSGEFDADNRCPEVLPLSTRCEAIDRLRRRLETAAATLRASPAGTALAAGETPESIAQDIDKSVRHLKERKVNLLELQLAVNALDTAVGNHIAHLQTLVPTSWHSVVTTEGDLATRRSWYMSADTGLAIGVSINEVLPYAGTNLYFRPVNTEAPPGKFLTRFSGLIGFTWTDNILKEGERASLYGTSVSLVLGAGIRLTEILKVSGGVLMFKGIDPNPTIQDTRLEVSPFVSISGDFDVAKLLGGLFGNDATEPKTIGAGTKPE